MSLAFPDMETPVSLLGNSSFQRGNCSFLLGNRGSDCKMYYLALKRQLSIGTQSVADT